MAADDLDITILVTCYNERDSLVPTIQAVSSATTRARLSYEIIVTDDASSDDSVDVLNDFRRGNPSAQIRLNRHEANRGMVYGVFEAARMGRGRHYWVVAGDNNVSEDTCFTLLSHVADADIVIARVEKYAGRSTTRSVISDIYAGLVRLFSGCTIRYYNGSAIYRRQDLVSVEDGICGFAYAADSILRLVEAGRTYVEVPVVYAERTHGTSSALRLKNFADVGRFLAKLICRRARKMLHRR